MSYDGSESHDKPQIEAEDDYLICARRGRTEVEAASRQS